MPDSSVIPFPAKTFDRANPAHVAAWITALPPTGMPPNKLPVGHFGVKIDGVTVSFRITRAALVAIDGGDDLSSSALLQLHEAEVERQCRALYAGGERPANGWVLDAGDVLPVL